MYFLTAFKFFNFLNSRSVPDAECKTTIFVEELRINKNKIRFRNTTKND
jgi:hypothetical protein